MTYKNILLTLGAKIT